MAVKVVKGTHVGMPVERVPVFLQFGNLRKGRSDVRPGGNAGENGPVRHKAGHGRGHRVL